MTIEARDAKRSERGEPDHDDRQADRPVPRRLYPSRLLFDGTHEVLILHAGEEYRLRITRAGKLILTK